ncbi:MAG: efflux RND transporter permease subunit, partial [Bacteroidales bacterium]|nr:efflux RND transporter permease subunit [Bacteroidales bacterium]
MIKKILSRPVLATVISIIIVFLGILGITRLPRILFPDIAPPTVYVFGSYPGGNSESVTRSVIIPLEEAINGVENMEYMNSSASSDGSFFIEIVFKLGTDPDQAAVNVQNRTAQANSQMPSEVLQAGITTVKRQNSNIMLFLIRSSDRNKYDELFVQNYAKINLIPAIKRVKGVGNAMTYGEKDYAIRVWLDPQKLTVNGLTPSDVETAIQNASFEASPGKLGSESRVAPMQYTIKYKGKSNTKEDFEKIVVKSNSDGSMLRIRDLARVEFGSSAYDSETKKGGMPAVTIAIQQAAGSNANEIETEIREILKTAKESFPEGIDYTIIQSTKERLDESISQVTTTLIEAFLLVVLIVFIFLQDFRSTLIPAIAVPVSIIGAFFLLYIVGFSINVLTLFALVLAIGIVVDDAIVVVEAVHSKIEEGLEPKEATRSAMSEITGVIISITLVMCAVFLPVGFMEGPAGIFYKQFAFTLVFAILISAINALTLSPVLCALFLKPPTDNRTSGYYKVKDRVFYAFNTGFKALTDKYLSIVKFTTTKKALTMVALIAVAGLAFWMMNRAPKDFIPMEDDKQVILSLSLSSGTNLQYTIAVADRIDSVLAEMPEVEMSTTIVGFGMLSGNSGSSYATGFIKLKPTKERGKIQNMDKIIEAMYTRLESVKQGELFIFRAPPVEGFGNITGSEM